MELQVGVKIILQNKEGKYLMLFRSSKSNPKVGEYWDTPGGRINVGSSLIENLKREVMEEAGLEVSGEPKLVVAQDIFKTDKHVVRLTYFGFADGEVKLSEEHSEHKWLSRDEVLNLDPIDKYFKEVFEKYIK
jgi:8-oxo-dGTP diphosphatase